jgi:methionyl-tRNA formyltransferase
MKIIFAGTPEFAVPTLRMLLASEHELCAVYTQPDRPAGRGRKLTPSPVKALALTAGVPVLQPESLKTPDAIAEMQAFEADLLSCRVGAVRHRFIVRSWLVIRKQV